MRTPYQRYQVIRQGFSLPTRMMLSLSLNHFQWIALPLIVLFIASLVIIFTV